MARFETTDTPIKVIFSKTKAPSLQNKLRRRCFIMLFFGVRTAEGVKCI